MRIYTTILTWEADGVGVKISGLTVPLLLLAGELILEGIGDWSMMPLSARSLAPLPGFGDGVLTGFIWPTWNGMDPGVEEDDSLRNLCFCERWCGWVAGVTAWRRCWGLNIWEGDVFDNVSGDGAFMECDERSSMVLETDLDSAWCLTAVDDCVPDGVRNIWLCAGLVSVLPTAFAGVLSLVTKGLSADILRDFLILLRVPISGDLDPPVWVREGERWCWTAVGGVMSDRVGPSILCSGGWTLSASCVFFPVSSEFFVSKSPLNVSNGLWLPVLPTELSELILQWCARCTTGDSLIELSMLLILDVLVVFSAVSTLSLSEGLAKSLRPTFSVSYLRFFSSVIALSVFLSVIFLALALVPFTKCSSFSDSAEMKNFGKSPQTLEFEADSGGESTPFNDDLVVKGGDASLSFEESLERWWCLKRKIINYVEQSYIYSYFCNSTSNVE